MGDVRYGHHHITLRQISATVAALDAIPAGEDPEGAHLDAEHRVLEHLRATGHEAVAEAFKRCAERVGGFWYA